MNNDVIPFEDKRIVCCDCYKHFIWLKGEQAYFLSKRLSLPKRCPDCRRKRRESIIPDPEVEGR